MPEVRKLTLAQEGLLALERGALTFRSQWPCKLFHLAERSTHSLECVECAKIRRAKRDAAKEAKRREMKPNPRQIVNPSLKMKKYGLRSPAQKIPVHDVKPDTPEDKQRRIANANATRERTRKAREALAGDRAAKPVPTWYVPENLRKEKS